MRLSVKCRDILNEPESDHCGQHCDGVVYKADFVIETVLHQDKCETVETSICRILPGYFSFKSRMKTSLNLPQHTCPEQ